MIRIAILGSTGSIGRSTLAVAARHPERFRVVSLAAHRNGKRLAEQAGRFGVGRVVLSDEAAQPPAEANGAWGRGREALVELAADPDVDVVVNALVGSAGLEPTLAALEAGHRLALANKESLVAGGPLVMEAARRGGGMLVPIDSEHSAILQCIQGQSRSVHRVVLTASGGPFRGRSRADLAEVGPEEALRHPTWDMGAKITIDSATLANKALEVIEAHFLYGLGYDRIGAVIHPQSVIHSLVEFEDGSILSQMGFPTMELPILYALSYPERIPDESLRTYDPVRSSPLTFEEIDHEAFPLFRLGTEAGARGGGAPAAYNAGNEIAVEAFLKGRIGFPEMAEVVGAAIDGAGNGDVGSTAEVLAVDTEARARAAEAVEALARERTN